MHKRYIRTNAPALLEEAAGKLLDVTIRPSRNKKDPANTYVVEGPDEARKAINRLVDVHDIGDDQ